MKMINIVRMMGVSEMKIFFKLILLLVKCFILVGIMMSFVCVLGEFGVILMVVGYILNKMNILFLEIYFLVE